MYVCVCFMVSDIKLKELIKQGKSLSEIAEETRATTNCGSCEGAIQYMIDEFQSEKSSS